MNTVQAPVRTAPPAPAPSAAPHGLVRVTGVLEHQAELRFTPGATPRGVLLLHLASGAGLPFEALHDVGCDPAAHNAAAAKGRRLCRGSVVTVYARGVQPRIDHGRAVLCLMGVTDVVPEAFPSHPPPRTGIAAGLPTDPEA